MPNNMKILSEELKKYTTFIVRGTWDESTGIATIDKTYSEARNAIENGRLVVLLLSPDNSLTEGTCIFTLYKDTSDCLFFNSVHDIDRDSWCFDANWTSSRLAVTRNNITPGIDEGKFFPVLGTISGLDSVTINNSFHNVITDIGDNKLPVFIISDENGYYEICQLSRYHTPDSDDDRYIISFEIPSNRGMCSVDWIALPNSEGGGYDFNHAFIDTAYYEYVCSVSASLNYPPMRVYNADRSLNEILLLASQRVPIYLTLGDTFHGWMTAHSNSSATFTVLLMENLGEGELPYMVTATLSNPDMGNYDQSDDTWTTSIERLGKASEIPTITMRVYDED